MHGYAVVDVETTGLYAGGANRVIEVAVVHLDVLGRVTGEWSTLVNPRRDLGPTRIHGIMAVDVRQAPTFEMIAPTLASLLVRRVMVAHNLPFDARFLAAEYTRLGIATPLDGRTGLCTMRMAAEFLPQSKRSLAACCAAAGIPMGRQHDAMNDARAAARLLAYYLANEDIPPPWDQGARRMAAQPWPCLAPFEVSPVRRGHASTVPSDFLARLADRLPRSSDPAIDSYLAVLDEALLDRYISVNEADTLVAVAGQLGMDRASALAAHRRYLMALAGAGWEDGEVTSAELADIREVAVLLGLTESDVSEALDEARGSAAGEVIRFRLEPGDIVVFTGQMSEPREVIERSAAAAGLAVAANVTKKTSIVVAADPESLSGKARKACSYGIPIIAESAFKALLGDMK